MGKWTDRIDAYNARNGNVVHPTLPIAEDFAPDLIPQIAPQPRSDVDDQIDQLLARLGIVDAYRRWCGKMEPKVGNKTESIMVSCPFPGHVDNNPSAYLNSDKNVGNCALCGGFDRYDLAAWHFNLPRPSKEDTKVFPELRRKIAVELGLSIRQTPAGNEVVEEPPSPPALALVPDPEPDPEDEELNTAQVVQLALPPLANSLPSVPLDWRSCILPDSHFLKIWMELSTVDDLPEEYHLFDGFLAIGAALGNDIVLEDTEPVRGNLMVCLVGPSGLGKSRATRSLKRLLDEAFPFGSMGGHRWIAQVGSGEALIDEFNFEELDPMTGTAIKIPVRGCLRFDELSTLTQKASRLGSTIKQIVMEMYDSPDEIHTRSRSAGVARARDHFFQMVSSTQPSVMSDLLTDNDSVSGFLNRWVFVNGTTKPLISARGARVDIEDAVIPLKDIRTSGMRWSPFIWEEDAFELWDQYFHSTVAPLKLDPEAPMFARSDLLIKKLMLLIAADQCKRYISRETVEVAIRIWEWLRVTYEFVQGQAGVSAVVKAANTIEADVLRICTNHTNKYNENPTMRNIRQGLGNQKFDKYGREPIKKALNILCVMGELNEYSMKAPNGKMITRWQITG